MPSERARRYESQFGSIEGVDLTSRYWSATQERSLENVGANQMYRFLLDMMLCLECNLDSTQFDFNPVDYRKLFEPELPPSPIEPRTGEWSHRDIERMLWDFRCRASTKEGYFIKHGGKSLAEFKEYLKRLLVERGCDAELAERFFEVAMMAETKPPACSLVGVAVVGVSKVAPDTYPVRDPRDYKTEIECKNVALYESHVEFARVGYSRVTVELTIKIEPLVEFFAPKEWMLAERYSSIRIAPQVYYPAYTGLFYPRVFHWGRVNRYPIYGSKAQLHVQSAINIVKQLLDREGVMANLRTAYQNYALEVAYKDYRGHRWSKHWKPELTVEQIRKKYIRMGLDPAVLEKIDRVIPSLRLKT